MEETQVVDTHEEDQAELVCGRIFYGVTITFAILMLFILVGLYRRSFEKSREREEAFEKSKIEIRSTSSSEEKENANINKIWGKEL